MCVPRCRPGSRFAREPRRPTRTRTRSTIRSGSFLTPALLAFAGAALLVGAFIIFNTFTITVAERTREFAMLRTLGATRGQILGAVALEALVIGVGASGLGLVLGLGFAKVLASMFEAVGLGLPTGGAELAPRTIALSLGIGIGVTQLAALGPARRATRVPPIAALQGNVEQGPRRRWAPWIAGITAVLGVAMLVAGLFAGGPAASRLSMMAGGVVLLFVGVALSARWFVRPLAGAVGWPLERLFAEPGLLARENAMRNPGRTATTAAALMVGLGLVVFVAVFANGIKASFDKTVDQVVGADVVVRSDTMQPIPAGAGSVVQRSPDISASTSVLIDQVRVNGKSSSSTVTDIINGVAPANLAELYRVDWVKGDDAVARPAARRHRARRGAVLEDARRAGRRDASGSRRRPAAPLGCEAIGVYRDPQLLQGTIVPQDLFDRVSAARDPWMIFAATRDGVDADTAKKHLTAALADIPTAAVESQADYAEAISGQLDQFVYLLYALLAMSVVISLFGIANSLFLSIHERTREFGLLRAVGATKAQVRQMVRYESVITAVIGGLLGTAIGILFALLVTSSLDDLGLGFDPPLRQLGIFLLLAVAVGVIAAVVPARRGARMQVLDALRAE